MIYNETRRVHHERSDYHRRRRRRPYGGGAYLAVPGTAAGTGGVRGARSSCMRAASAPVVGAVVFGGARDLRRDPPFVL